jgi:hypothetical protein
MGLRETQRKGSETVRLKHLANRKSAVDGARLLVAEDHSDRDGLGGSYQAVHGQ